MKMSEDSAAQTVLDAENPWPGLDFFSEDSREFFQGRNEEADLLLSMVRHRLLTVLYGQSGLGKSSLLQAGLFPRLRADGWLPVYIRLSHTDADGLGGSGAMALITQTRQFIREAIADAIEQGALVAPAKDDGESLSPFPRDEETLWQFLHRRESGLRSRDGSRVAPVLVFDQFEEIFTLGRNEARRAIREIFLRDLADCVENRLPADVMTEMNRRPRSDSNRFADLDFERQDYRIVLSLREDYLAELHDLSELMPSVHENETRLVPLNGWQALDAVSIPGESLVDPVVAREIVEIVAASGRGEQEEGGAAASNGESIDEARLEVDPALLSMVCRELNIERQRRNQAKITPLIIEDLLKSSGRSVLRRFYTECFSLLPDRATAAEVQKFIEDDLLTPAGYRNMAELSRAEQHLTKAGVPNPGAAIQQLINQRLLRISERRQDKTKWLELTHDVLCDVVKESRHEREMREAQQREERAQRERAARQLQESERQRAEAEDQAREAREREAKTNERMKQMRRERRLGIVALVLTFSFAASLCLVGFLVWGRLQIGADAQARSRRVLQRAYERMAMRDNDRRDVLALRHLARALRNDPANREAAKLACDLMVNNNWSPPISPPLHYAGTPLLCAAFGPQKKEIIAIAQDGNLVRWNAETFVPLPSIALLPDKPAGENKAILSSAVISDDGERILVGLLPAGRENARVWVWSDFDHIYHPSGASVNFKDTVRSASWSHDGNLLFIFPLRFDQPACRAFSFNGSSYVEKGAIPNVSAGAISPDDRWLATAEQGGKVQIWDAQTLQPAPETPELKTSLAPEELSLETRISFLRFSGDGQQLGTTAMREPARVWDLRTGKSRPLRPKSSQDQIIRIDFATGARGEQRIAAGMNGMVGIWDTNKLDQQLSEPICVPEAMIYPTFNSDGTKIITLSGPFWMTMDTVRVWDTSFRKPVKEAEHSSFDGKSAPRWLSELAEAITGMRVTTDEDDLPPPTLSDLRKKYAGTSFPEQYAIIWNRFLRDQNVSDLANQP